MGLPPIGYSSLVFAYSRDSFGEVSVGPIFPKKLIKDGARDELV